MGYMLESLGPGGGWVALSVGPGDLGLDWRRTLCNQDGAGVGGQRERALGQQAILKASWEAMPHNAGNKGQEWASAFAGVRNLF